MPTIPETTGAMILFYAAHAGPWAENAQALDLDAQETARLGQLVAQAQAAARAKEIAADQARSATQAYHNAADELARLGASLMQRIRAAAKSRQDPEVYALANIPAPRPRGPIAAPGRPYAPQTRLHQDGTVQLNWRCKNPPGSVGTVYIVRRSVDGGPPSWVASVGKKQCLDAALPAGASQVAYEVTAVRSTRSGTPAEFIVRLGRQAVKIEPARKAA